MDPMRRTTILVALALASASALASDDHGHHFGKQVRYVGIHPLPRAEGGGMCNIEGPHVHIFAASKLEYRDHGGDWYFVGDPVAYKYDGPKYAYKGPHPIHVEAVVGGDPDVEYCYLEGPHFHYFQPEGPDFKMAGDAYFYVGEPPQAFLEARPTYVGINATYRPLVYTRPVVEVEPPSGWIGVRAEFVTPSVVVAAPTVEVVTPGVVVYDKHAYKHGRGHGAVVVGGGAVIGAGIDVHVVAPPPPSISIGVGVGVGVSGGAVIRGGGGGHRGRH
jgi:hypothetical protein